jgi:hypothetical protein
MGYSVQYYLSVHYSVSKAIFKHGYRRLFQEFHGHDVTVSVKMQSIVTNALYSFVNHLHFYFENDETLTKF